MLLVDQSSALTVLSLALLATTVLFVAEWRRADRRRRAARLGATVLAVAALAGWALRPAYFADKPSPGSQQVVATLWTAGATSISPLPRDVFALPGANVPAGVGVTFLPDPATWRRRNPDVGRLRILGDGLEPADLPSLDGLQVEFVPGPRVDAAGPSVRSLRCPRVLSLGETLTVEGRVGNLPVGQTATLTLEAPDGTTTEAATAPADANGEAGFTVHAPSSAAPGRFLWRLRLKPGVDETVGVEVRAPSLPRVLVLESVPRFDTAGLRRWYEEAGGTLRARVRLGQDRYRFFGTGEPAAPEFNALDPALLVGFDLVLADARALASLPAPEREILRMAVADTGLGLLVLADDAVLPPAMVAPDRAWMFPWQLRPLAGAADGTEPLARLRWRDLTQPADLPLPTAPCEIVPRPGQSSVVRDDQGRTLAAVASAGRGTLALTLVRETGRWTRANQPGAFAGYWSFLFARTARPLDSPGRWTLAGGDDGPVFVDEPLELRWHGPPPGTAQVTDESGAAPVALPLEPEPGVPGGWRTTFWPRRPGWHRVGSTGGTLDFYVAAAGDWPALRAERRRMATARFAARSVDAPARPGVAEPVPLPAGWWFAAFLVGAGFLWVERRVAGSGL